MLACRDFTYSIRRRVEDGEMHDGCDDGDASIGSIEGDMTTVAMTITATTDFV